MPMRSLRIVSLTAALASGAVHSLAFAQDNPMVGGAPMFANKNIVENAVNSKDHTTLVAAVQAAGLVETLSGAGPFTVFAPVNAAFDALPAGTVDTLLKPENKDQLTKVLTCHVVAADAMSNAISKMISDDGGTHAVTTVGGCVLQAKMDGDKITLTDETGGIANITIADVDQSNGVIHVIDKVLLPGAAAPEAMAAAPMAAAPMAAGDNPMVGGAAMFADKNIVENAVNSKDHTTLVAAVKAAGLVEALSGPGPFTVFAPVNAGFDALPAGTVEQLLKPEMKGDLTKVLTSHVVAGKLSGAELMKKAKANGGRYNMNALSGDALTAQVKGGNIYIIDESGNASKVTIADVNQSNGVIHVIDKVLLPR